MTAEGPAALDRLELRRVAGYFATGVAVVTSERDRAPCGLTVNSFTSLSLDPPLVLVCFDRGARSLPCVDVAGRFAVNVLAEGQEDLSRLFASKEEQKFTTVRTRPGATGLPLLVGAHAYLECTVTERHDGGDHVIFIGRVDAVSAGEGRPLLFYRGRYDGLRGEPPS